MDFGRDTVDTNELNCKGCNQPIFLLLDETPPGGDGFTIVVGLLCINRACGHKEQKLLTPAMNEGAGSGEAIYPLPGVKIPDNALLCGNQPVAINPKTSPDGKCHGFLFRLYDKGNEILSRCTACGDGDTVGILKPISGQ